MNLKLLEAIKFASTAHDGQKRADNITPYISHPFAVGMILSKYGYDDEIIIAGFLHDILEDTKYTLEDIENKFGKKVAEIVAGVTENNNILSKEEKFEFYIHNLEKSRDEAKIVCAADMLHNRLSVLEELDNKSDIWRILDTNKKYYFKKSHRKLKLVKNFISKEFTKDIEKALKDIEEYKS